MNRMNAVRGVVFGIAALFLFDCSAPLVPPPFLPREARRADFYDETVKELERLWAELKTPDLAPEARYKTMEAYNSKMLNLVRRVRSDFELARKEDRRFSHPRFDLHVDGVPSDVRLKNVFDDFLPARDVRTRQLEEHYVVGGLGVPVVGIVPESMRDMMQNVFNFKGKGFVCTLTAVMEFPEKGKPELRLIPRLQHHTVRVGNLRYELAGDFSAPMEVYWNLTKVQDNRILGLLQPQKLADTSGLVCIEPYNPSKIPVILTHGLMSSAGTFDNLVNRLLSDKTIRKNYQFWYFNYPTGVSWVITAAQYRAALRQLRRKTDPHHTNKNWDKMVVVGHSMGGLITHYSQCVEPWLLLRENEIGERLLPRNPEFYVRHRFEDPVLENWREQFFFEPVRAGLVIYMATPHRGAPLARYRLIQSLIRLIKLPQNILDEAYNIITLQQDSVFMNPEDLTEWFTSVKQLSPDSPSIRGLYGLAVRSAPTHSIIGDRGCGNSPRSSDGVVPYWSSHLPWGSEAIVPTSHSVQSGKETAEDMKRVLHEYLLRNAGK